MLTKALFIKGSISNNPHFPSPSPSINQLEKSINAFSVAVQKAESGDRQEIGVRNQAKELLIQQLHRLAHYVLFAADGNEVIASSSGFTITKQRESAAALVQPQKLVLKNGVNKGELEFSFRRVAGVRAYMFEITSAPVTADSKWESSLNTIRKQKFAGLQSGLEYACRVAAIGIKQQVVYSDTVSRIAL